MISDPALVQRVYAERILREDPLPSIDRRVLYMGLVLVLEEEGHAEEYNLHARVAGQFALRRYVQFRQQLLWGPWDRVVSRRTDTHAHKLWNLRAERAAWGDYYYYYDYPYAVHGPTCDHGTTISGTQRRR